MRPETTVHATDLAVAYESGDNTFTLKFPLLLSNDGNANDVIQSAESKLLYSSSGDRQRIEQDYTESFDAGIGNFTFYDRGTIDSVAASDKVPLPLQIGKASGRPIFCSILFDKGTFTRTGLNRLNVTLIEGNGNAKTFSFCFFLDEKEIQDLQQTQASGRKRFLTPNCRD